MAWGNFLLDIGMDVSPGNAITKFYAVKYDAALATEHCIPIAANSDVIAGFSQFGVTLQDLNRGKGATVRVHGVTEAVAVGAIPLGSLVTLEADGRVSALVAASGKRIVGKCVGVPAVNAGDRLSLLINPYGGVA